MTHRVNGGPKPGRVVAAGSAAFWLGMIAVILGHVADAYFLKEVRLGEPFLPPLAVYFLMGGLVGAVLGSLLRPPSLPQGVAGVLGFLILYPMNIFWLSGERWLSVVSVGADAMVLIVTAGVVFALRRAFGPAPQHRATAGIAILFALASIVYLRPRVETPAPDGGGSGPDVLLIAMDSVRADHVSYLGYRRPTAAPFRSYLPEARIYERAYALSSWTLPSSQGILGADPTMPFNGASTVPARLKEFGYASLLLSDNPHLVGRPPRYFGMQQSLRSVPAWRMPLQPSLIAEFLDRAIPGNDRGLADRLAAWLQDRTGPVYVHAHLMNAHAPFRFPPIDGQHRSTVRVDFPRTGAGITGPQRDDVIARYDEGVRTSFAAARRMIETMRARKRPLLVIVTADHGELLGENDQWFHGNGLEEEIVHVPLLLIGDGVEAGRSTGLASHAQIAPTILAAAQGLTAASDLRKGATLAQVEGYLTNSAAFRVRDNLKVVISKSGTATVFEWRDGRMFEAPRTGTDLVASISKGLRIPLRQDGADQLDPETLERLKSLGYTGAGTPGIR